MKNYIVISNNTIHLEWINEILSIQGHKCLTLRYEDREELENSGKTFTPDFVIFDIFSSNFDEECIRPFLNGEQQSTIMLLTSKSNPFQKYYFKKFNIINFLYIENDVHSFTEALKGVKPRKRMKPWAKSVLLLTVREYEILRHIAGGKTSKEIAIQLQISKNTVDTHRNKMLQKLNLSNSTALVNYAIKSGLI
ncbi:response regulator transcription factor [Geovibrio thiophilus]|uniref:Response regulator transcription factor n=1 Tax=Geovibrio thiophilus TaxID=139438 RepID=A0A3R5UX11_9BACT|nr:response regulator transcription factor [Geovibrio thiophilus]QAR32531.1 response regulator transcription factor [Geovibrio thiophilus]